MQGKELHNTPLLQHLPKLDPLLRFLATSATLEPSPACLRLIHDAIEDSPDVDFTKSAFSGGFVAKRRVSRAYVHGVLFQAWLGIQPAVSDDVFALSQIPRLSAIQYGTVVVQCSFEKYMLQSLYLVELPVKVLERQILELCHCYPQLVHVIFPFIDQLTDSNESAKSKRAETEFAVQLLQLGLGQLDRGDSVLKDLLIERLIDLSLLVTEGDTLSERSATEDVLYSALKSILQKWLSELPEATSVFARLAQDKLDQKARQYLRTQLKKLRTVFSKRKAQQRVLEELGWLGWDSRCEKLLDLSKSWQATTESGTQPTTDTDDAEVALMRVAVSESLGWLLSQVSQPTGSAPIALDCSQIENMVMVSMQILKERASNNACLFHAVCGSLYRVLSSIKGASSQISLLAALGVSQLYHMSTGRIRDHLGLTEAASSRLICLSNQLMQCGAMHEGEIADREQSQEHLAAWIDRIFPLVVLFPHTALRQFMMNALLYDAQQPLLIKAIKHFSPIFQGRPGLVLLQLKEILAEVEVIPSDNLCAFVQSYLEGEHPCEKIFFLEEICGEHLADFESPTCTAEGLIRGALGVSKASEKQKWLLAPCLKLLVWLSGVFQRSSVSGNASHPSYQSILPSTEQLFEACSTRVASLVEAVTPVQSSALNQHCQSLDWYQRIRFASLMSAMHTYTPLSQEILSLFLPERPEATMETDTDGVAQSWMELLSQMFWCGSASEAHCIALCSALQSSANSEGVTLLDQISLSFVQRVRDLPVELQSWGVIMAIVENLYTASSNAIQRTLQIILPQFLQSSAAATQPIDRDSAYMLSIEIFCRALYVLGSHIEMDDMEKHYVLSHGQTQLAAVMTEILRSEISPRSREMFSLRSFIGITTLMNSMNATQFDGTELQILLIHLLQDLVSHAQPTPQGWVLSSGVSLQLVVEWIWSWIAPLKPSYSNCLKLALNRVIKDKLEHL